MKSETIGLAKEADPSDIEENNYESYQALS